MQLAITILGKKSTFFIFDIVSAVTSCHCTVLELRASHFSNTVQGAYLFVEGNWNCVAKLDNLLHNLQKRLDLNIQTLIPEQNKNQHPLDYIPYSLETISIYQAGMFEDLVSFLSTQQIVIAEVKSTHYPAPYTETNLLSSQFILWIPPTIPILSFREELLNFCDQSNLDAIFEPIKR